MILETPRMVLREMSQEDSESLCMMLQDERVMYAYEGALSLAEAQVWLDLQISRYRDAGFGLWAVVLKETGDMVGQCGLTYQECDGGPVVEVGYLLQEAYWHRGLATEAARACRDYAFDTLGVDEVYSIIRDTNEASQRVARRNGMTKRSVFVKHYRGVAMPHLVFSVTREERDAAAAHTPLTLR